MLVCMHVGASGVYMCYACRCEHLLCVQVCMHVGVSICCVHVYACRGQCCMYIGTYVRSSASCVCVHAQGPAYIYIYICACMPVCVHVCVCTLYFKLHIHTAPGSLQKST